LKGGEIVDVLKKVCAAGIPAGLLLYLFNAITGSVGLAVLSNLKSTGPTKSLLALLLFYISVGLMLALVYVGIEKGIKGSSLQKGLSYGFVVWLIGVFPGLLSTLFTSKLSYLLVSATYIGLITGFIAYPLTGAAITWILDRYYS
jgi:hypothetical protein